MYFFKKKPECEHPKNQAHLKGFAHPSTSGRHQAWNLSKPVESFLSDIMHLVSTLNLPKNYHSLPTGSALRFERIQWNVSIVWYKTFAEISQKEIRKGN